MMYVFKHQECPLLSNDNKILMPCTILSLCFDASIKQG